jgi:hypothetical protein
MQIVMNKLGRPALVLKALNVWSTAMRLSLVVVGILLGAIASVTPAKAQNYPWCAIYNKGANDMSCSFDTFDQCKASVSGIGGFCMANNTYVPPAAVTRPHPGARHRPHKAS